MQGKSQAQGGCGPGLASFALLQASGVGDRVRGRSRVRGRGRGRGRVKVHRCIIIYKDGGTYDLVTYGIKTG